MTKKIIFGVLGALAVVVIVLGVNYFSNPSFGSTGIGANHTQKENFLQGLSAGTRGQFNVSNTGNISQAITTAVNTFLGLFGVNSFTQGIAGFSGTFSTTSTLTGAQFCGTTNLRVLNTTATITLTTPAATSSWVACGSPTGYGGWQEQIITNDSTNSVVFAAGTGVKFLCNTTGVGTTTVLGGCTSSTVTVNATSTAKTWGFWDAASSSLYIQWGSQYH